MTKEEKKEQRVWYRRVAPEDVEYESGSDHELLVTGFLKEYVLEYNSLVDFSFCGTICPL